MRNAALFIIMLLVLSCQSAELATTDAKKAGLIPGSENPIIKNCSSGKAYLYKDYEIHVEPSPEHWGMNIFLYIPEVSEGNPCTLDRKTAAHIISTGETDGNNFFAGLYENYLFIDQGAGPDDRILSVYHLTNKKLILLTEYSDPDLQNGILTYYKTIVPDPGVIENIPCPESEEWKAKGLTVLYEQKESFTLKTQTKEQTKEYRCRAGQ